MTPLSPTNSIRWPEYICKSALQPLANIVLDAKRVPDDVGGAECRQRACRARFVASLGTEAAGAGNQQTDDGPDPVLPLQLTAAAGAAIGLDAGALQGPLLTPLPATFALLFRTGHDNCHEKSRGLYPKT